MKLRRLAFNVNRGTKQIGHSIAFGSRPIDL